jgi:carboxylate-amine ligase
VDDRNTALAVLNHLTSWLPALLAVTVNSPYHRGQDTGFASWRLPVYSCLPGAGPPPWYRSLAHYDAEQERMVEAGLWPLGRGGLQLARLSWHLPTVEIRIADACASVADTVLYAALARALVRTALTDLAAGRTARPTEPDILHTAVWMAARHGLARAVDPRTGCPVSGKRMLATLLDHVTPALDDLGDTKAVRTLLAGLALRGTGADRQRRHGPAAAAAAAVKETLHGIDTQAKAVASK